MELSAALGLDDRELVAFVGAGGKKTAMARLVDAAEGRGLAAGYTTTTHVPPPELPVVTAAPGDLPAAVADRAPPVAFAREWVDDPDRADRKLRGYDPAVVDRTFLTGPFDWLLVKADGARRREFKAPGPGEPAVPAASTHVVPVAAVSAVGAPLSAETVHRVDRVADLTGLDPGEPVTAEAVGAVLASEDGGLKGVPEGTTVTPLVNKADTEVGRATARRVLAAAFERSDRLDRGVVASLAAGDCEVVTATGR